MKSPTHPQAPAEALRLAQLKAGKCIRVADADKKAAHSAKIKFKAAKKLWKQSRKQAKRSAKLAKLAQKDLATLAKKLRRTKSRPAAKKPASPTPAKTKLARAKTVRRRSRPGPRTAPQPPQPASPTAFAQPPTPSAD